jgi:hypothetical protein
MLDVRRLAALDMHGRTGSPRRSRIIRIEFWLGAGACLIFGTALLVTDGADLIGVWLCGAGLNYLPLALHANSLSRPGALDRELDGVDIPVEARRAFVRQFLIAVPGAVLLSELLSPARKR